MDLVVRRMRPWDRPGGVGTPATNSVKPRGFRQEPFLRVGTFWNGAGSLRHKWQNFTGLSVPPRWGRFFQNENISTGRTPLGLCGPDSV